MKAAEEGGSPVYEKSVEILQLQRIIRDCGERKRKKKNERGRGGESKWGGKETHCTTEYAHISELIFSPFVAR